MNYHVKADPLAAAFDRANFHAAAAKRPRLFGSSGSSAARGAFVDGYLRKGTEVELKSISSASLGDGGYAIPQEIDAIIDATLKAASPIRSIANVVQVGSAGYRKLVTQGGVASGWASDSGDRNETDTPTFNEIVPSFGDLFANPAASQAMLDDVQFDVETWLAGEIAAEFAKAEGAAFINGDGVDKPRGFLTETATGENDDARAFGSLQYVATGSDGDFASTDPEDALINLVHSLRAPYRQGAVWVMNSATLAAIRKMKTADGAFIWQPGINAGQPDLLLGYPVAEAEEMPDIASDSMSIAFGNFQAGYLIAERPETGILRDPYSNKPFVHFYATKRVGGAVSNSEAIKLMKFGVS